MIEEARIPNSPSLTKRSPTQLFRLRHPACRGSCSSGRRLRGDLAASYSASATPDRNGEPHRRRGSSLRNEAMLSAPQRTEAAPATQVLCSESAKRVCPKRNGGRHCCQPPLRRAKDLPVFLGLVDRTLRPTFPLSILAHQLRRRFRSNRSLLRGARLNYSTALPEGSLVFRPARPAKRTGVPSKAARCSAALLGSTTLASRFAHQTPRGDPGAASRLRKIDSSGASSRLAPARTRKLFPLPAGGDRTFGHLPHPPAVAGSWGGRDRRPDHLSTMHPSSESRKRKNR